ncbi:hypothetical protein JCM9533A_32520 [Catenuloplanes niger JCM 9533]
MVALVVALAAGAAGFAWLARPRLAEGSMLSPGAGFTWANDGVEDTRMLLRGRPVPVASARFTVRNEGRVPVTLTGLDTSGQLPWTAGQRVTFQPGPAGVAPETPPVDRIEVAPGGEAIVNWSLDLACRPVLTNAHLDITTLPLRVRTLGLSRTYEFPLRYPMTFAAAPVADPGPTADCGR